MGDTHKLLDTAGSATLPGHPTSHDWARNIQAFADFLLSRPAFEISYSQPTETRMMTFWQGEKDKFLSAAKASAAYAAKGQSEYQASPTGMTSGLSAESLSGVHCETGADGGSMPPSRTLAGRSAPETYQSLCARRGVDGFVSAVDAVLDRATESDEPEWGDSETAAELSAGIVRGCR